ncbi:MAG TPA: beta-ketoacyl-ACP synthase II [Pyrinomonadaceae bacterium]|nr:beta-ketoacyl-ACP synthase II [Pyrinomonadaceae bacterium]
MRRVAITGLGVVSPIGNNVADFWSSIAECRSGIGPITKVTGPDLRFGNCGEVRNFVAEDLFDDKLMMWLDPFSQYGVDAANQALADSAIEFDDELRYRTGVVTGSCLGGKTSEEQSYFKLFAENNRRQPPTLIPKAMGNAVASQVSMLNGFTGPSFTTSTACSSSNHAIGQAFWMVRQGILDVALAGGSEAPLTYGNLLVWGGMRVVSTDTCRPFSKDRSGMILGEGGAMLVLEELEHAKARGAKIYAEMVGFGMSADAHHLTMPLSAGASRAMASAVADGGLALEQVGYINAHGTATPANDSNETRAIRETFGKHADSLAVSSTKSLTGHSLGGAGAIEAATTILGLHNQVLPPTANYREHDPECDLDVVPNASRPAEIDVALSNSFAFGGLNAVVAFRTWTGS